MDFLLLAFAIEFLILPVHSKTSCNIDCHNRDESLECGFDRNEMNYKMFPSKCAFYAYKVCHEDVDLVSTPIDFCIKNHARSARRMYGESCPVFCPSHYRPVCAANKYRSYSYRTFNNGCYLDMINCRGNEDFSGYVEVPLEFCPNHLMKNIFRENVVVSNLHDYADYEDKMGG